MTTYTSVFGNEAIPQSDSSYAAVQLAANTTFFWSTQASGPNIISDIMDVTPTGAYTMTMPPANQVSVGREVLIRNMGSRVITLHSSLGATLGTVSPGETKFLYIVDNSTVAGVWRIVAMGTGVSAPDAAVLAGNGLRAVSSTLNQESLTVSSATSSSVMLSNLASTFVYVASGAVVCSLLSATEATNGFFFNVSNQGTGQVTIDPFGVQLIDGEIYKVLAPGESATVVCTGLTWVTIGHGRSTQFQFTKLVLDITSGSPFTLTSTQAQNKLIEFIGTLTADAVINLPSVTAVYYTECSYTGVFNVTVKTAVGTGVVLQPNERSILYCDGMNVVMAQTANVPVVNITGGVAGALPYQAAPDTTSFTSAGMLGDVLRSGATGAPTWQNPNEFLVQKTSVTGSALLPAGTTLQRDVSPIFGMLRGNTDTDFIEYWGGTGWNPIDGTAVMHEESFTATGGQTTFVLSSPYVVGIEALTVYINGLEQGNAAYNELDTHTIVFTEGLAVGDYVEVRWGTAEFSANADAANVAYTPTGAGAVATTVERKLREGPSVKDFGATGGGLVDDRLAIQAALAAGGKTFFPAGTYRFVMVAGATLTPLAGATLEGCGVSSVIAFESASTAFFRLVSLAAGGITLRNLRITWATPVGSSGIVGFVFGDSGDITLQSIHVNLGVAAVLGVQNAPNHLWSVSGNASRVNIIDSYFTQFKFGILKTNASTTTNDNWRVEGNTFENFFSPALTFNTPSGDWDNVRVANNNFFNNLAHTIGGSPTAFPHMGGVAGSAGTGRFVFSGNTFSGTGQGLHFEEGAEEIIINSNTFSVTDTALQIIDNNVGGVRLTPSRFIINANTIVQTGAPVTNIPTVIGIDCIFDTTTQAAARDVIISNNVIKGYTRGIQTAEEAQRFVVTNNIITDCVTGLRSPQSNSEASKNTFMSCPTAIDNMSAGGMVGENTFVNCAVPFANSGGNIIAASGADYVIDGFSLPPGLPVTMPICPLGTGFACTATLHLSGGLSRRFAMFNLVWDGTTLTGGATAVVAAGSGSIFAPTFTAVGGNLLMSMDNATGSAQSVRAKVSLRGGLCV